MVRVFNQVWEGPTYRSHYVVDYEALTILSLMQIPQTICMADNTSNIDNAPDTSLATMSRTLNLILDKRPLRYQIEVPAPGSTASNGPQARDRIYHKIITNSSI
jgi:hypothetical protein